MKTPNIIEGLTILQKYRDKPNLYHVGAEHDQLYAYATDKPVSQKDIARLIALGWWQDRQSEDDEEEDGDFRAEHYDQEESWTCFV